MRCRRRTAQPFCSSRLHGAPAPPKPLFSWTDVTHLLHNARVSWGYYLGPNGQPTGGFLGDAQCYR